MLHSSDRNIQQRGLIDQPQLQHLRGLGSSLVRSPVRTSCQYLQMMLEGGMVKMMLERVESVDILEWEKVANENERRG